MQRKTLKKLVCVSGLLFMTFPAWSAVPSNLLPTDGSWIQSLVTADISSTMVEGDISNMFNCIASHVALTQCLY